MKLPSLRDMQSNLLFGAYIAVSFPERHKKLMTSFAVAAATYAAVGLWDRHDALHSLELQLQAKGQNEVVAKCIADAVSQRRSIWVDMVQPNVYKKLLKDGHALAASGAITECTPR